MLVYLTVHEKCSRQNNQQEIWACCLHHFNILEVNDERENAQDHNNRDNCKTQQRLSERPVERNNTRQIIHTCHATLATRETLVGVWVRVVFTLVGCCLGLQDGAVEPFGAGGGLGKVVSRPTDTLV